MCLSFAGVVYRARDTSLVIAVDDVPEEGMDQPLRIEKLANEVTLANCIVRNCTVPCDICCELAGRMHGRGSLKKGSCVCCYDQGEEVFEDVK